MELGQFEVSILWEFVDFHGFDTGSAVDPQYRFIIGFRPSQSVLTSPSATTQKWKLKDHTLQRKTPRVHWIVRNVRQVIVIFLSPNEIQSCSRWVEIRILRWYVACLMNLGSGIHISIQKKSEFKKNFQSFLNVSRPSGIAVSIPGASMIRLATLLARVSRAKHSGASWWTSSLSW